MCRALELKLKRVHYMLNRIYNIRDNNESTKCAKGGQMLLICLSFERPYLIKGLNLMIAKSIKSVDFGLKKQILAQNHGFHKLQKPGMFKNHKICEIRKNLKNP